MYADVEALARQRLLDAGLGVEIATAIPNPCPDRFIRLQNSGSRPLTIVHRETRLTVECWSAISEEDASQMAEQVYEVLDAWDLVPTFTGWPSTPYPQADMLTGTPRYVMTCIVQTRQEDE